MLKGIYTIRQLSLPFFDSLQRKIITCYLLILCIIWSNSGEETFAGGKSQGAPLCMKPCESNYLLSKKYFLKIIITIGLENFVGIKFRGLSDLDFRGVWLGVVTISSDTFHCFRELF